MYKISVVGIDKQLMNILPTLFCQGALYPKSDHDILAKFGISLKFCNQTSNFN